MSRKKLAAAGYSILLLLMTCAAAGAQSLWTEGAEQGLTYITDGTHGSYSLIQSAIVAKGNHAFHLATPDSADNWFELDQDITVQADTQLFFLSRLGWATPTQVAKVQVSTDGGTNWPIELYAQGGTGDSGEGAFVLQQVPLGSYASQSLRFRFLYDFTGGSHFPQTDADVGWLVDDIQIGSQLEKIQYSVGDPTPYEQEYLEYVNRARADAVLEAQRLANETDPEITSSYSFFGVSGEHIVEQFAWYIDNGCIVQNAQPLSFNEDLLLAAQLHTQDMFNHSFQGHTSSANPPAPLTPNGSLGNRLDAVGYSGAAGENVFSFADSVAQGHAGFDVDWGNTTRTGAECYNPDFSGQGMQNPAGHRLNIHNGGYQEAGIGVINGTNGSVGPQLVTQDFGDPGDVTFVTGVVYEDLNGNDFYDIGEGRSGVRVDVDGSAFYATSSTSGAYSIPVSGDGIYLVEFSGAGFSTRTTMAVVTDGENVKVDYLATTATYLAADYNQNGTVDMPDYLLWKQTFGSTGMLLADGNGDLTVNAADFVVWRDSRGQSSLAGLTTHAVPEPALPVSLLLALVGILAARRNR